MSATIYTEQIDNPRSRNYGKWVACRVREGKWRDYVQGQRWMPGSQSSKFKTEAAARKAGERIADKP